MIKETKTQNEKQFTESKNTKKWIWIVGFAMLFLLSPILAIFIGIISGAVWMLRQPKGKYREIYLIYFILTIGIISIASYIPFLQEPAIEAFSNISGIIALVLYFIRK